MAMQVRILGAHQTEIGDDRPTSLVIDGLLGLDAGSLCSGLSLADQRRLKALLVTHQHYDHVKDLPLIGLNLAYHGCLQIYGTGALFEAISPRLMDGQLYPDFRQWPPGRPSFQLHLIEEYRSFEVEGFRVLPVPVPHSVPAVGFQVTAPEGPSLFYTGDTGGGLRHCWEHVAPDLLITEMTFPGAMEDLARQKMHLSPPQLAAELMDFRRAKGYVPPVLLIHLDLARESEVVSEVAAMARELGVSITLGREGMAVTVQRRTWP